MLPDLSPVEAAQFSGFSRTSYFLITVHIHWRRTILVYGPGGPTLEFEVVADRTNFTDMQTSQSLAITCELKTADFFLSLF